jgi:hypothetical protein
MLIAVGASTTGLRLWLAAEGTVVIAVGPNTPANAVNRIDTIGRHKGAFVCRIVSHERAIEPPKARKIKKDAETYGRR